MNTFKTQKGSIARISKDGGLQNCLQKQAHPIADTGIKPVKVNSASMLREFDTLVKVLYWCLMNFLFRWQNRQIRICIHQAFVPLETDISTPVFRR